MRRKIISCCCVAALLFSFGCSSSYEVSSSANADKSYDAFNIDAYDRNATMLFQDGKEVDVRNIIASRDSTSFLDGRTDAITTVPTHTITDVVIANHGAGFLEGLEWGAIVGSAIVVTPCAADGGQSIQLKPCGMIVLGLFGGAVAGVIGGLWGVIPRHRYEYQFPASAKASASIRNE